VSDKEETKEGPQVRVVDRRWWARGDTDESGGDSRVRKPSVIEELERQLADKAAQLQSILIDHRRALDEFEQVKARIRRDTSREVERGRRSAIAEFLDVLDNLDRAIAAAAANPADSALLTGVRLVRDQFLSKLQGLGVSRLEAIGQPFDASRHEAISTAPVSDPAQDGTVVAVVKEGYAIGEDVLRPASVVVGKADTPAQ
jgi:molecular chaperone GrpE